MTLAQRSLELLQDPIAARLLGSTELARLAYNAKDGTPRVIPMLFHWTGQEVVFGAYAGSAKLGSPRANPDVAITIDTAGPPPDVLLIRGRAERGGVGGTRNVEKMAGDGIRMVRIAVRPTRVGALDFQTRLPGRMS